uniref:Uncharacterized protein n=1 Tax=viral metagenome TaxID=1070528 RepID=A0A6C0LBE9_9ZZZZ
MIEELMKAKQGVESFKLAIFMAAGVNNEVAMDMRIGVLLKLTEKVEKIQRAIDDLVKTNHILFETPFYENAYISVFRNGKTIVKIYDLHENKDNQDWALTRSKERFDEVQESDNEGYYWAIVRYDYHLGSVDEVSTPICHFALTSDEGISLHRQLNEWQNERDDGMAELPNYIYLPEQISCHSCSTPVSQLHEKSISDYIYQFCSKACAEEDYTTCSNCGETEVSKKDCANKSYDCCQQYLGGQLQYYCSIRCEGEDQTAFISSFSKPVKKD